MENPKTPYFKNAQAALEALKSHGIKVYDPTYDGEGLTMTAGMLEDDIRHQEYKEYQIAYLSIKSLNKLPEALKSQICWRRIFIQQTVTKGRLPFKSFIKTPNAETLAAMREVEEGKTTRYQNLKAMLKDLGICK